MGSLSAFKRVSISRGSPCCSSGRFLSFSVRFICISTVVSSETTTPLEPMNRRFSSFRIDPPPVASNTFDCCVRSSSTLVSRVLKPSSPSTSKIQAMLAPALRSTSSSVSINCKPSSFANILPIVVLPTPMGPIRKTF